MPLIPSWTPFPNSSRTSPCPICRRTTHPYSECPLKNDHFRHCQFLREEKVMKKAREEAKSRRSRRHLASQPRNSDKDPSRSGETTSRRKRLANHPSATSAVPLPCLPTQGVKAPTTM